MALLGLMPLLVFIGSTSIASAVTTPEGVPQPLHVSQSSLGPKPGMRIVGSPNVVWVDGQSGRVALGLFLTNKGTVPYACKALTATQIPTKGVYRGRFSPQWSCTGRGLTIAPGSRDFIWFVIPGNTHLPKDIVVLPYTSNTGRMVWTVAGCPTLPKSCLGRFQKLPVTVGS